MSDVHANHPAAAHTFANATLQTGAEPATLDLHPVAGRIGARIDGVRLSGDIDEATFDAESHNVAIVAMLALDDWRGAYGAALADGSWSGPLLMFGGEKWLKENGMVPLDEWVNENKTAIFDALESVALGGAQGRRDFDDACEAITDPVRRRAFIARRNDRRRSSMNDFETRAHTVARQLAQIEATQ